MLILGLDGASNITLEDEVLLCAENLTIRSFFTSETVEDISYGVILLQRPNEFKK